MLFISKPYCESVLLSTLLLEAIIILCRLPYTRPFWVVPLEPLYPLPTLLQLFINHMASKCLTNSNVAYVFFFSRPMWRRLLNHPLKSWSLSYFKVHLFLCYPLKQMAQKQIFNWTRPVYLIKADHILCRLAFYLEIT